MAMNMIQGLEMEGIALNRDGNQYLSFILAGEEYGIDILRVQEIKGWNNVTPIPNTPKYIKGVINLRGTIVPIIDLRERFNLETIPYGATTVVIVLRVESEKGSRIMGIVVDAVSEVYNIAANDLKAAPDFGQAISTDFVKGLATVDERMVIVLDIDHLLNSSVMESIRKSVEN
jgi:purine-binding chemotaxis protein CheW